MNNLEDIVAFVRKHGTPKLQGATDAALRGFIGWALAGGFLLYVPNEALLVAWPCQPPAVDAVSPAATTLYIANFCRDRSLDGPAVLRRLVSAAAAKWPQAQRFAGHRVAAAQRWSGRGEPRFIEYPMSAVPRLLRFA